jgi:hypothetical protein
VTGDAPDAGWWAPIVHARTKFVDKWWRAMPPQMMGRSGPEVRVLDATLGDDGVRAPRLVLARLKSGTLLGVACHAEQISKDMGSDGGRPVPCFIGWLCADPRVAVPQLDAMESGWTTWAAAEYARWMRDVWLADENRVGKTDETTELRPPWELTGPPPQAFVGDRQEFEEPSPEGVRVYSAADAARVWRGIDRYGVNATVVTGWSKVHTALQRGLTHACVEEFQGPAQIYRLPPVRPAAEKKAAAAPAAPGYGTAAPGYSTAAPGYSTAAPGYGTAAPGYGTAAPGYGTEAAGYGRQSHETARGRGTPQPDTGYGHGAAGEERPAPGGRPGFFSAVSDGVRHIATATQKAAASVVGGDPGPRRPPAPPTWGGAWTLRIDKAEFRAWQDGYKFSYRIGAPTIECWPDGYPDQRFRWTASGWESLTPQPPEPRQQPQAAAPGWQPPGFAPPKAAGSPPAGPQFRTPVPPRAPAHGAAFDEFEDAPLPDQRPVLAYEETGEAGPEAGGAPDTSAHGSPPQTTPPQTTPPQTTPPEWSPEE